MCLKNKIIAATLCALIAGIGIFGVSTNFARAQVTTTTTASMSIDQLQQIINSLIQQIQQLIQQIAILKPLETCGNGICRFGETATSCPADCGDIQPRCETTPIASCISGTVTTTKDGKGCPVYSCTNSVCGNGTCETDETAATCAADCGTTACVSEGSQMGVYLNSPKCCAGLSAISVFAACSDAIQSSSGISSASIKIPSYGVSVCTKCGDGICGLGENKCNCPADCDTMACAKKYERIPIGSTKTCCSGLIKQNEYQESPPCTSMAPCPISPIIGYFCDSMAICGDRSCEPTKGETATNCQADCATCANEGEVFTGTSRQCCSGLEMVLSNEQQACPIGTACQFNTNYTCQSIQSQTSTPTCNQNCKAKGYTGSYCSTYGSGPFGDESSIPSACASGWTNTGTTNDCNANNLMDAGRTCCCGATTYPVCGNGTCETGETTGNCVADCGKTCQQQCLNMGYISGVCRSWTRETTIRGCFSGETSNGPSAKDCNDFGLSDGAYQACCCAGNNNLPAIHR